MKKFLKIFFKTLAILFLAVVCLLGASGLYIYYHRDKIVRKAFEVATAQLPYPIHVKDIQLSFLENFPQLSLVLHQVLVDDTIPNPTPLLAAQKVSCTFNLLHLIANDYQLEQLIVADAKLVIADRPVREQAFQNTSQLIALAAQASFILPLQLHKLMLQNVAVEYTHLIANKPCRLQFLAEKAHAKVAYAQGLLSLQVDGQLRLHQLTYASVACQSKQPIAVQASLQYDIEKHTLSFQRSTFKYHPTCLTLEGSWRYREQKPACIDMIIKMSQLPLAHLLPLVPLSYRSLLQSLHIEGLTNCELQLQQKEKIKLAASFQVDEASFLPKHCKSPVLIKQLIGKLISSDFMAGQGTLRVEEGILTLGNSCLKGEGDLDLKTLQLTHQGKLLLDLPSFQQCVLDDTMKELTGQLVGEWRYEGGASAGQDAEMYLQLLTKNVQFPIGKACCQLVDSATLTFKDHVLSFSAMEGAIEGKNFTAAGSIMHLNPFAKQLQPTYQLTLCAEELNFDTLLAGHGTSSSNGLAFCVALPGRLDYHIESLSYKDFHAKKLKGKAQVANSKLHLEDLSCYFAGGRLSLAGSATLQGEKVYITTQGNLQRVALPTLFSAFDNFKQTFLQARHLEGHITSTFQLALQTDLQGKADLDTVVAAATLQLHEGALKNFEPLQKLAPYTADKALSTLRFSDLKNTVHIEKKTITIPPMEVHTNLMSLEIGGTHTFDGKIDYNLVIPLQYADTNSIVPLGGINPAALAGLNLYLKLEGDTQRYTLRFDGELLKASLQKNLQNQLDVLKRLLQDGAGEKQAKGPASNDYFDFD
jgi:hypothetical protein